MLFTMYRLSKFLNYQLSLALYTRNFKKIIKKSQILIQRERERERERDMGFYVNGSW